MVQSNSTALLVTLPSDTEIKMTRVFNAPRDLVFEAHTKCEHLENWWGPEKYKFASCEMEFRAGGKYRFVQRGPDGEEFAFRGEYREVLRPERIVWTFEFEGMPGQVSVETMTLVEEDGKTAYESISVFASKEERDAMLESGMEGGANESMDRLDTYLRELS